MPTYRDIKKILKRYGASLYRQGKGSHEIWILNNTKIVVPKHPGKEIKKGMYLKLVKDIKMAFRGEYEK